MNVIPESDIPATDINYDEGEPFAPMVKVHFGVPCVIPMAAIERSRELGEFNIDNLRLIRNEFKLDLVQARACFESAGLHNPYRPPELNPFRAA
jgi:hypothetical protein